MVELFSYRGTFKLPLLHSIVSACQFILLDHCAHYAQSIEDFVNELHRFSPFGVLCRCLFRSKDRCPWSYHSYWEHLQLLLFLSNSSNI